MPKYKFIFNWVIQIPKRSELTKMTGVKLLGQHINSPSNVNYIVNNLFLLIVQLAIENLDTFLKVKNEYYPT